MALSEPPRDDGGPSDDDAPNHGPPPNNGFWQSIVDFLAGVCGSIESIFWDIFDWVQSALINIYEKLGDCLHNIMESLRNMISALQ